MLFQNPNLPLVYPPGYYFSLDYPLWIIVVFLSFLGGIIFIIRGIKTQIKIQKGLYLGMGLLLIFLGIMRIFYIIAVRTEVDYDTITEFGYLFEILGLICLIFEFERYLIKKSKYSLTILNLFGFCLISISIIGLISRDISRIGSTIISTANTIIIMALFILVIIRSVGIVKKRSKISFIGIILTFLGNFCDSELIYGIWTKQPLIFSPILIILGLIILILNQKPRKKE